MIILPPSKFKYSNFHLTLGIEIPWLLNYRHEWRMLGYCKTEQIREDLRDTWKKKIFCKYVGLFEKKGIESWFPIIDEEELEILVNKEKVFKKIIDNE